MISKPMTFKIGDAVRVSAAHLRSICPNAARGWPTRLDPGLGYIVGISDLGTFALLEIWFENTQDERRYNHNVIIHAKDTYNDAMRAEHSKRSYVL
jgi:hypothetical protein